jgi:hypothetical protein
MATQKMLDQRAGALPEIRLDGDSVTFHLEVMGLHRQDVRLMIRCDAQGEVWVSLTPKAIRPA